MLKAVNEVLTDESFQIDLEPCKSAYKQAQDTMKWATDDTNTSQTHQFETALVAMLKRCLPQVIAGSSSALQGQRVDVWRKYHHLRTSPDFFHLWSEFLATATGSLPEPSFFQEASDRFFRDLVMEVYPLPEAPDVNVEQEITYTEANVVRYIAGYICHKIYKNIQHSSLQNKEVLLQCLDGLIAKDGEDAASASAHWVNVVDRGGLVHINEATYMLFCSMEEEVRHHLQLSRIAELSEGCRKQIEKGLLESDDLLFHWCMLTVDIDDSDASDLLGMIVHLWITVRGYSFTSAWLEMYKQSKKKALQKSKALRKDIHWNLV